MNIIRKIERFTKRWPGLSMLLLKIVVFTIFWVASWKIDKWYPTYIESLLLWMLIGVQLDIADMKRWFDRS